MLVIVLMKIIQFHCKITDLTLMLMLPVMGVTGNVGRRWIVRTISGASSSILTSSRGSTFQHRMSEG